MSVLAKICLLNEGKYVSFIANMLNKVQIRIFEQVKTLVN
jgi:hypothetical protein